MVSLNKILASCFLFAFAIIPVLGLFWEESIGIFKVNWILYPFLIWIVLITIFFRNSADKRLLIAIPLFAIFSTKIIFNNGDWQDSVRFFFSLLPLFLVNTIIQYETEQIKKVTLGLFILSVSIPILISFFQMTGEVPYIEFDTAGGEVVGRLSGGYSKPNNFVTVLFPLLLFSFYLFIEKKRKFIAAFLILFILFIIYETGLRIAVVAFSVVVFFSFFSRQLTILLLVYYKYFLNFIFGFLSFWGIHLFYNKVGLVDGLRGRFPIWQAHSTEYFKSNPIVILFGKGIVNLEGDWDKYLVRYLSEVHNNSYRIILLYGIIGFTFYSLFMRYIAMKILRSSNPTRKLLVSSCFLYYILYSITNEPAFYPAIAWSIFFWVFIKNGGKEMPLSDYDKSITAGYTTNLNQ